MRSAMTENDFRGKMLAWKKDLSVIEGMELIDVMIAEMDREIAAEQKKNTRRLGRMSLRSRLGNLVASILSHTNVREKGAAHDTSQ